MFQAVDHPRLTQIMRTWPDEGRSEAFWLVDGVPVIDLDEAIEAIDVPPALSAEELDVLDQVPREWTTPDDLRAIVTAGLSHAAGYARVRLLRALANKGLLEIEDDKIRRRSPTVAG
ncbi:hypothetical protein [Methylobacterium planeticum]|uniref:Uncharacterized protein n=1 Tax=Methylobacterium planeticum TaxID=2615211 RepID=A0A6N6MDP8_9HYPH|nr:hypothetical protein [Methylobacterium planeticum]KAB1068830.1 hypothetical protein F6X51_26305 [Methylobacterium planeticum]